jgi:hypothetical protein
MVDHLRAEGREEGRAEGRRELIQRQLRKALGAKAADLEARLAACEPEALIPIADLLVEGLAPRELRARLNELLTPGG